MEINQPTRQLPTLSLVAGDTIVFGPFIDADPDRPDFASVAQTEQHDVIESVEVFRDSQGEASGVTFTTRRYWHGRADGRRQGVRCKLSAGAASEQKVLYV